jgi:hypothetical protein
VGELIEFPTPFRTCETCEHALFGNAGTYCRVYHVDILDPITEANQCDDYDPTPWAVAEAGEHHAGSR